MLLALRVALSKLPWQVWFVSAVLALLPLSYCKGRSDGKQVVLERLERAEQKAAQKAVKAASAADEKVKAKTEIFEAEQDVLRKAIDDAEAQDENALDAIF